MAIENDFAVDYTNKRIHHVSGTTVYTVNALYTWLMDLFDEVVQMDNPVPMSAQTPNAYTLINGWFLDIGEGSFAHKYLKEGAIETDGWGSWEIHSLTLDNVTVDPVSGDRGKEVQDDAAAVGPLLGYLLDPYGANTGKWWIRDTRGVPAQIDDGSAMTIPTGSGTGDADGNSISAEWLWANVYTLGALAATPNPQIYIFQGGEPIVEWSELTNWARGHIDIVLLVKEAGVEIDSGLISVFARQQGDLFDNYEIDLTAGGRNAVPMATSADLDNTTPDFYIFFDNLAGGTFALGDIIQHPTSGTVQWSAEVCVAPVQLGSTGIYRMGIRGYKDDGSNPIADDDAFEESTGTVTAVIFGSATACLGTGYVYYDAQTGAFTTGDVLTGTTSTAERRIIADAEDGAAGMLLFDLNTGITGTARIPYYKDFQDNEEITDETTGVAYADNATGYANAVSAFTDITVAFVNGTATYGSPSGTFVEGERATYSGGECIILRATGSVFTLGNVTLTTINGLTITGDKSGATGVASQDLQSSYYMTKAFEQQANKEYDIVVECGEIYNAGRTLAQVYEYLKYLCSEENSIFQMYTVVASVITPLDGEEYIKSQSGYTAKKVAPFGNFAGGKFFGAQSVWVEGEASAQSYQLIDRLGAVQDPPSKATMKIISLVSGDRVLVAITAALGGDINKALYNSNDTLNIPEDTDFEIEEDIDQDIPASGVLRVVDDDGTVTFKEQRYRYSSWTGKIFALLAGCGAGSATTGGSSYTTQLIDSAADFGGTDLVEVGDVIYNISDGSSAIVTEIVNTTTLNHTPLEGGSNNYWTATDTYKINVLDRTYDDGDTAYVPLLDLEADATTEEVEVLFDANRFVMIRIRKKGIIPFQTSGTFIISGLIVAAIRTVDGIVS